jgi:hypothetical protein
VPVPTTSVISPNWFEEIEGKDSSYIKPPEIVV